ncbi:PAS domain-containing protein [Indioceanicola profundi]|uniref:PAS domain-containing protein n=1 Tax=Indioceanicola profundi TaxID=2220096 RepID=UPI000E6AC951|nr:PAS domain-containing protein [Indioceanicola profundi]
MVDNLIISANGAFRRCAGQNHMLLAGQNTDPEVETRIRDAMSTRQNLVEDAQFYRKDGTPIWVAALVSSVRFLNLGRSMGRPYLLRIAVAAPVSAAQVWKA